MAMGDEQQIAGGEIREADVQRLYERLPTKYPGEASDEEAEGRLARVPSTGPLRVRAMQDGRVIESVGVDVRDTGPLFPDPSRVRTMRAYPSGDEVLVLEDQVRPVVDVATPAVVDDGDPNDMYSSSAENCLDRWTCCIHRPPAD